MTALRWRTTAGRRASCVVIADLPRCYAARLEQEPRHRSQHGAPTHPMRGARPEYDEPSARTVDATDIGSQHPARYGQNDCEIALGRKSWLFAGSERGADRAAVMATLITTAKMNDVDPQAWLADVLARIAAHPAHTLDDLLPWNWRPPEARVNQAA